MNQPRVVAIIPAGGRGRRMGGETPKQYLPLAGRPLLWRTLSCFEASLWVEAVILVLRPEDMEYCQRQIVAPGGFRKLRCLTPGGRERSESVAAGLQATLPEDEIVVVHDAVRPFLSQDLLAGVIQSAAAHGAAIAAVPARDTIKQVGAGRVLQTPERASLWSAQTPQAFRRDLLLRAYRSRPVDGEATDDAMLVERLGCEVRVVRGDDSNLKITTSQDLAWAEWRLGQEAEMGETTDGMAAGLRVGMGHDVHALAEGRALILGGVHIPHTLGLAGHSDADVLTHAIVDALLGAVSGGDIGRLFPDTDPQYEGVSSLVFLQRVRDLLAADGARILNIDAVVMAQKPRLASHIGAMEQELATALALPVALVSVKATTTEGMGFVGREEGIAAQAVVLVQS